jgi:hypothetical protein
VTKRPHITLGWNSLADFLAWTTAIGLGVGAWVRTGRIDPTLIPFITLLLTAVPARRGIEGLKRRALAAMNADEETK